MSVWKQLKIFFVLDIGSYQKKKIYWLISNQCKSSSTSIYIRYAEIWITSHSSSVNISGIFSLFLSFSPLNVIFGRKFSVAEYVRAFLLWCLVASSDSPWNPIPWESVLRVSFSLPPICTPGKKKWRGNELWKFWLETCTVSVFHLVLLHPRAVPQRCEELSRKYRSD